jgi:hypothetical protein
MPALKEMTPEELREHAKGLRSEFADLHERQRNDEDNARVKAIIDEVNQVDFHLTSANIEQERQAARRNGFGPAAALAELGGDVRSLGELVTADERFAAWMERGGMGSSPVVEIDGGLEALAGVRASVFEFGTGGPPNASTGNVNTLLPVGQPIAPTPRRARLYMRDLIPVQTTGLSQIPYVRELNPTSTETGASAVAEGQVKPDQSINFQGEVAPVTVVAGNITVSRQIASDAAAVMQYINGRLPYLVKFTEDDLIIAGNGTWPQITGILNTPGILSQAATAGQHAITIGTAIAKVEGQDGYPNAVVMNPTDAWNMFTLRAASGAGTFDAGIPFSMASPDNLTVWGLPVKRSRVYPAGQCLVGDFAMGAMIWDREQVNVQMYPQNEDYAKRNLVLLQAEERIAFGVFRPDLFVNTAL